SVSPVGFFQRAMSRDMFTSWGIQWLAQVERYFSQAHLYLNGTSWLTSVSPLMMRLSAARTRCAAASAAGAEVAWGAAGGMAVSSTTRDGVAGLAVAGCAVGVAAV